MGLFRHKTNANRREDLTHGERRKTRLSLELLESRLTPAVVLTVNAAHSFVSQLSAATAGETLQIEPGAVMGTLGTLGVTTAAANAGDTTLEINAAFAPGQLITISDTGDTTETDLIDAVSGPVAGNYVLTLHSPLADSHQSGSTVTAVPATLGIGKGIAIQGDPKDAPSTLLGGTILEYFPQNGSPVPDALTHLMLTAVEGTTSSNLSITGDTFAITAGSTDAVNVVAGAALTISTDAFTVGYSASPANVIAGQTDTGAINFAKDMIRAAGDLSGDAVTLTSMAGALNVSDVSLTVSGTIGGSGLDLVTNGDVTVSGKNTLNLEGAVTGSALGVSSQATVNVSNVTASLSSDAGVDGMLVTSNGNLTAGNLSVTVGGSVLGTSFEGAAIELDGSGSVIAGNLTESVKGTANYGIYIDSDNMSLSGTVKAELTGAVADDGVHLDSLSGNTSISGSVMIDLGSTTGNGFYINSPDGTIVDNAPITVTVSGDVSYYGVSFVSGANLSLRASLTVKLEGAAGYGGVELFSSNGTVSNTAPLTVTVAEEIGSSGSGLYVNGQDGAAINKVMVTLDDGSAGYGAYLEGNSRNFSVNKLKINVTGAVAGAGLFLDAGNSTCSDITVNLSSEAENGIYVNAAGDLTMTNTTDTVGGAVTGVGAFLSAGSSATASNLKITLANSSTYALEMPVDEGNLVLSGLSVTELGAASDEGVYLGSVYGNLSFSNSTVALKGGVAPTTDDAVEVDTPRGNTAITKVTIQVAGSTAAGLTATAAGSLDISGSSITTGGGTGLQLDASGYPQTIENDTFNTGNAGTGLAFSGGSTVVALVQGNNFQNNLIGVAITGDGTNAGEIDLGGGLLGSKGKNNFIGFTGASGHDAIMLNDTNATSTVYALLNKFSVTNPNTTVQDAANNGGSGIIDI